VGQELCLIWSLLVGQTDTNFHLGVSLVLHLSVIVQNLIVMTRMSMKKWCVLSSYFCYAKIIWDNAVSSHLIVIVVNLTLVMWILLKRFINTIGYLALKGCIKQCLCLMDDFKTFITQYQKQLARWVFSSSKLTKLKSYAMIKFDII